MAKWNCYSSKGNLNLSYRNFATGQEYQCGKMRLDTPRDMILDWVVNQDPNPCDTIKFENGIVFLVYPIVANA